MSVRCVTERMGLDPATVLSEGRWQPALVLQVPAAGPRGPIFLLSPLSRGRG